MPPSPDRSRPLLAWILALAPALLLAVMLLVPGLRERLLGPAVPPVAPAPQLGPAPPGRPATPPPDGSPSPAPPQPSVQPSVARAGLALPSPRDPRTPILLTSGTELDSYLERSYRRHLPAGVGPIRARVEDGQVQLSSELDLDGIRQTLKGQIPAMLAPLVSGRAGVELRGSIVSAEAGVARVRLEALRIGGVPVPTSALELFLRAELEARGLERQDPLVRKIYLPPGIATGTIEGDQLKLTPTQGL